MNVKFEGFVEFLSKIYKATTTAVIISMVFYAITMGEVWASLMMLASITVCGITAALFTACIMVLRKRRRG